MKMEEQNEQLSSLNERLSPSENQISSQDNAENPFAQLAKAAEDSSPLSKEKEELLKRFSSFCSIIEAADETKQKAWEYLTSISPDNSKEKLYFACSLFLANLFLRKSNTLPRVGFSFMKLLQEVNLKVVDFYISLKEFIEVVFKGDSFYATELKQIEQKFVVITLLFNKYNSVYRSLFHWTSSPECSSVYGFGWTLFLISKSPVTNFITDLQLLEDPIQALNTLCEDNNLKFQDVLAFQEKVFVPILQMLSKNEILLHDSPQYSGEFKNLLSFGNLKKNFDNVNREYQQSHNQSELDERYLEAAEIGTPSRIVLSPSSNKFEGLLTTFEEGPSTTLLQFFRDCRTDLTEEIQSRVKRLADCLSNCNIDGIKSKIQRGIVYYYHILETMLQAEKRRLRHTDFTTLLSNDEFHKSLLASALEIVFFSFKDKELEFPFLMNLFNIKPFEFIKIIESVIRSENLDKSVIKYLGSIEEKILESMAWEDGSPLIDRLCQIDLKSLTSPMRTSQNNWHLSSSLPPGLTSPMTPSRRNSPSVELFFRKLFRLTQYRCNELCTALEIKAYYQKIIQTLFYLFSEHISLLFNRHLDQLIMCSIYGVCRIHQQDISFKKIIEKYRSLFAIHSKVFREVVMESKEKKNDIIHFYNAVYIPTMESYLLKFRESLNNTNYDNQITATPISLEFSPMKNRTSSPNSLSFKIGQSPKGELFNINNKINSPLTYYSSSSFGRSVISKPVKRKLDLDGLEPYEKKKRTALDDINTLANSASNLLPLDTSQGFIKEDEDEEEIEGEVDEGEIEE